MKYVKNRRSKKIASSSKPIHQNIYIIILSVLVIAIYGKTTNFDFVNIDDAKLIFENPIVTNSSIPYSESFSKNIFDVHYKPLVFILWKAEYNLFGGSPGHFHIINWLFHLANTLLLFFIGIKLFDRLYNNNKSLLLFSAFLLALLFTINPLRIESVAWTTERKDVLFAFFFLISWLIYIHYIHRKKYGLLLIGAAFYLFSGLSKSMGITLLAVLFLTDFWYNRKFEIKTVIEKIPFIISFFVLAFLYGLFKSQTQPTEIYNAIPASTEIVIQNTTNEFFNNLPQIIQWLVSASLRFILWLVHSLIPAKLSIIYPHDTIFNFFGFSLILFPFIVAGLYFWGWKIRKKSLVLLGSLLFYGITLSPALALNTSGQGIFLSDRYTYIPSIGLFFLIVVFINNIEFKSLKYKAIIGTILLFYFVGSIKNVNYWKNSETLFTQAIDVSPGAGLAYLNLGRYYREQNNYNKALKTYSQGIKNAPGYYKLYSNRGKIYFDQGKLDIAISDFDKSLSFNSKNLTALVNRGAAYGIKEDYEKALSDLSMALEINPNNENALSNRGLIYIRLEKYEKTIEDYTKIIELNPNNPDILNAIGLSYHRLKKYQQAITEFNRAISINDTKGAYFMNRSLAFNSIGDKINALKDALRAQQLGHNVNPNYINFLEVSS